MHQLILIIGKTRREITARSKTKQNTELLQHKWSYKDSSNYSMQILFKEWAEYH